MDFQRVLVERKVFEVKKIRFDFHPGIMIVHTPLSEKNKNVVKYVP